MNCQENTYSTGTLCPKRLGTPPTVKNRQLVMSEYLQDGTCVCKWSDYWEILSVPTEFGGDTVPMISKRGIEQMKPQLIKEYNRF